MLTDEEGLTAVARRNQLLVRLRRPIDQLIQFAAVAVAVLLVADHLEFAVQATFMAGMAVALILQFYARRVFIADRSRRQAALAWRLRFLAVYAFNAMLLGTFGALLMLMPREPAVFLSLIVVLGITASLVLSTAVDLLLSLMVLVLILSPGLALLFTTGLREDLLFATVGFFAVLVLSSFAWRLYRYHERRTRFLARLRILLRDRSRSSSNAEAAQARLQSILDTAPFPIVVVRRSDGAFLYSNRPASELFGIRRGAAVAGAPRYRLDPVHHARIFAGQPLPPDEELQIATAMGQSIWATIAAVPMQFGEEAAALVVVNDITEKKASAELLREAQQRLGDALAVAPDGVALFDSNETLLICNRAYAEIIGLPLDEAAGTSHDEVCQRSVAGRPAPEGLSMRTDYGEWIATRRRTFKAAQGEPHIFFDTRDRRWLQIRDFRLGSGGTASLITDISELKRRERELHEANTNLARQAEMLAARTETLEAARKTAIKAHQTAEYANRAKSQFLAHMSHELRTPLNAIIGFSEIMALQLLGPSGVPQYDRYAGDILVAGRHLLSVINDILDLSKVEAGKMQLAVEAVDWARLAADCLTLLRPLAADRMVSLLALPAPEGTVLHADERLAKQMLVNLVSNALKYTPSGGRATFGILPQADGGAIVEITDSGLGMTEAEIAKALEPFGRIDSALVSQMSGTGLGLPLVKGLIELHGGRLEIDSAPGRGTTARLHFPPPGRPPASQPAAK